MFKTIERYLSTQSFITGFFFSANANQDRIYRASKLDTVLDFFIKLGIKPRLHICIENKHIFTKSCHRQTNQNYEQPPQGLQNLYFDAQLDQKILEGI